MGWERLASVSRTRAAPTRPLAEPPKMKKGRTAQLHAAGSTMPLIFQMLTLAAGWNGRRFTRRHDQRLDHRPARIHHRSTAIPSGRLYPLGPPHATRLSGERPHTRRRSTSRHAHPSPGPPSRDLETLHLLPMGEIDLGDRSRDG